MPRGIECASTKIMHERKGKEKVRKYDSRSHQNDRARFDFRADRVRGTMRIWEGGMSEEGGTFDQLHVPPVRRNNNINGPERWRKWGNVLVITKRREAKIGEQEQRKVIWEAWFPETTVEIWDSRCWIWAHVCSGYMKLHAQEQMRVKKATENIYTLLIFTCQNVDRRHLQGVFRSAARMR